MSAELIGIIGVGIALLTVGVSLGALMVTLMVRQENRTDQRFDRLETRTDQRFDRLETRLDTVDERLRHLEQGQAYLSGEFSTLKDFFTRQPGPE